MAAVRYNVMVNPNASFDDVKRRLEGLGMVIAGESRSLKFLTGSIAQELEEQVRAVEGVKRVALDREVHLAG